LGLKCKLAIFETAECKGNSPWKNSDLANMLEICHIIAIYSTTIETSSFSLGHREEI
jgi:hypothetical protein